MKTKFQQELLTAILDYVDSCTNANYAPSKEGYEAFPKLDALIERCIDKETEEQTNEG